ncbi:hypothetical protein WICMUC_001103 [Wickerhamomyces mucosus]|uniref:Ribonucleases P/MRP subunit Pop8-like domain-containing protein n=1 Tax=Wickerhamomyces mucosus TaxID=1378264 RepID=A0A9P8THR9_9ASCO|nr:hypothetical protein WICMUC_001103 [Wickerhamomyces mucosus]
MPRILSEKENDDLIYCLLELKVAPTSTDTIKDLEVDLVSWKTYILQALKKLHGIIGSAIDVDIVSNKGKKSLIVAHKDDEFKVTSALLTFSPNLNIFGIDEFGTIEITKSTKDVVI